MSGILPPTPSVLRSYRLSDYRAGGVAARVGRRPSAMPDRWRGRTLVMLSAANPGGRRLPDGWNARMMTRLAERLRRLDWVEGEGRLGRWSEPLILVAIGERRGRAIARLFRQNAIILLRDERPARLLLLTGG